MLFILSYKLLTFWSFRKNCLIRKIKLIPKLMMSGPGLQIITIYVLPIISRSKSNQTMEFGQVIECKKRNIFLQKSCRKWGRETSSRPLFVFLALNLTYNKSKMYKSLEYWSRDMLNFDFFQKGSGNSYFTTFYVWFLYPVNWPNFFVFTSWGNGHSLYCDCLLTILWRNKFWN